MNNLRMSNTLGHFLTKPIGIVGETFTFSFHDYPKMFFECSVKLFILFSNRKVLFYVDLNNRHQMYLLLLKLLKINLSN